VFKSPEIAGRMFYKFNLDELVKKVIKVVTPAEAGVHNIV